MYQYVDRRERLTYNESYLREVHEHHIPMGRQLFLAIVRKNLRRPHTSISNKLNL